MRRDFSTDKVHPRTLAEVKPGSHVVVRDAGGDYHGRIATTGVVEAADFMVVWVCRPEEWGAAQQESREPDAVPWPAEDVWRPGDAPSRTEEGT